LEDETHELDSVPQALFTQCIDCASPGRGNPGGFGFLLANGTANYTADGTANGTADGTANGMADGTEGALNLAIWGAAFGLIGGFSSGLAMLNNAKYWGDFAGRYSKWWVKKEIEGEQPAGTVESNLKWKL
jgi:hypothetical protein